MLIGRMRQKSTKEMQRPRIRRWLNNNIIAVNKYNIKKVNITNKKVTKNKIAAVDFKNTVLNRIYKRGSLGQLKADRLPNDVLSSVDKDRIYVAEDGRSNVDEYNCTTVSAIKCLDENRFIQLVHHSP